MGGAERPFESRAHFFRTAAKAMRTILVDAARARSAEKRGGGETLVTLNGDDAAAGAESFDALAVHEALERLERLDPRGSHVVELRFFCGLEMEEVAAVLGTTVRTAYRDWETARAWLFRELSK
jgi:RNA polymerase sigma factor (TIGR02999 family)